MIKRGLGRGLSSLIPPRKIEKVVSAGQTAVRTETVNVNSILHVPVESIAPNPHQPRTYFSEWNDKELQESIKEHGILQPLIVTVAGKNQFHLIAGERRFRAAKNLKLPTVPVIVRQTTELEKLELALIENIQRQDLNPLEEATAYRKLIDEFGLTQEQTAKKLGKSRSVVSNMIRLLQLPVEIQKGIADGLISQGHAKVILGMKSKEDQMKFYKKVLKQGMSVRDTEVEIRKIKVSSFTRNIFVDPKVAAYIESLQNTLGTKVKVEKHGERGRVIIEFYSEEELSRLVNLIR